MTAIRLSRSQCERAIAAYLDGKKAGTPHAAIPMTVRMGELDAEGNFKLTDVEELPLPCVAITAPRADPHPMGYAVVELHVVILSSINKPSMDHLARVGWVAERMRELQSRHGGAATQLNAPDEGDDTRLVKDFRAFGVEDQDEGGQEVENAFTDDLAFRVHCQPTDDVSG